MIHPSILRAMLANGATAEMIVAVIEQEWETDQERLRQKRAAGAERQRRHRALSRNVTVTDDVTDVTVTSKPKPRKSAIPGGMSRNVTVTAVTGDLVSPKKINKTPSTERDFIQEAKISLSVPKRRRVTVTGSRLPEDWNPSEEIWQKAKTKLGLDDDTLRFETGAFRDHWYASTNANACKLNWDSAWRNWMREACRRGSNGRRHRSTGPPYREDAHMKAIRKRFKEIDEREQREHDELTNPHKKSSSDPTARR